ncbi:MAG: hypothetical protein RL556_374 [Actinomycetota bacterium]|jgi:hypothetical protein
MKFHSEQGSISVLGIAVCAFLLLLAGVLLNVNSLNLQQRQLNNLSDAMALSLNDLSQSSVISNELAESELLELNATNRLTQIMQVSQPEVESVEIELCQQPELAFDLTKWFDISPKQVCANSKATISSEY